MFREPSDSYIVKEAEAFYDSCAEYEEAEWRYVDSDDYNEALYEFMFVWNPETGTETPTGRTEEEFRAHDGWSGYVRRFMEREKEPDDYWRD
jgi:hypothetical protein